MFSLSVDVRQHCFSAVAGDQYSHKLVFALFFLYVAGLSVGSVFDILARDRNTEEEEKRKRTFFWPFGGH